MTEETNKLSFEASAYLQTLIGRELFRSRELAVVELVKNSYDSGARLVTIRIELPTAKRPAAIEVTDDGSGMDLPALKKLFMVAGYSEKANDSGQGLRIPTGEKGIGRFASDRLGSMLELETKTAGQIEGTVVNIDWTIFNARKKRFNEIEVPFYRRPLSFLQKGQSGTRLRITRLRDEPWNQSSIERLRSVLSELFNPFDPPNNFQMNLEVADSDTLSGQIAPSPVVKPDFDLRFVVKAKGLVERTLKHTPVSTKETKSTANAIDGAEQLVGLRGRFYYYLKRPNHAQVHGHPYGVFLYRDGFRIEPFGSGTADWLGIGEKRAKRAGGVAPCHDTNS